jgi:hypothetical protein
LSRLSKNSVRLKKNDGKKNVKFVFGVELAKFGLAEFCSAVLVNFRVGICSIASLQSTSEKSQPAFSASNQLGCFGIYLFDI